MIATEMRNCQRKGVAAQAEKIKGEKTVVICAQMDDCLMMGCQMVWR